MNGNIGTLTIEMAANVARLVRGMEQVNNVVDRTMGGIERAAGFASNALGLIGVGLSAAGIIAFGNRGIDMLAQLDDAAQKTGSSVENLSKIQRVTTELKHDFNAVESSIIKLAKGMATFDSETNYTARALKTLGINSRDAAGNLRDPSQVLVEIAKRLQDYQDGASKTALINDLLGKSGAELLPVLNDIADNVDRFSPVSAEAAAQAAQFQDQMNGMRARVDDAVMSFATGLFPALTRITASTHDAGDGMNFFNRSGQAVGNMFVWLLEKGSKAWQLIDQFGDTLGTRTRQLQALVRGDFQEIGQLEKNLDMLHAKRLAEHQAFVSRITGGNEEIVKTAVEVKKQLDYQTGTKAPAPTGKTTPSDYDRATKSATEYIAKLREETEAIGLNAVQVKLLAAARAAAAAPLEFQRMAIMASAQAWAEATQAQEESVESAKRLEAEEKKRLDGYAALVQADEKALESLRQKNDLLEYGASAIAQMGQADLQAALDRAWAADNIDVNVIAMLERRLELSKKLADETKRGEALEAAREAAKEARTAWENTARDINRSLTDALLRGFESGKGFARNLRDTVVNMFQTMILRPVISAVLAPVTGAMGGMFPGAAGATGMGGGGGMGAMSLLSSGSSLMSMMSGGLGGMVSGLGSMFGSSAISAFGAGMGMTGAQAGLAAGAYGAAGMAGTGSAISAGAAFAPFAGPLAVAAIADMGLKMLAGDRSMSQNGAWKTISSIPIVGLFPNLLNAFFGTTPKKLGPAELTGDFAADGFRGEFQADWTRKVGLFGGKKRGRRGLGIEDEQVEALNSMLFGITDSFKDFIDFVGAGQRSLDGWTFSVKQQIETEEQQAQLVIDVANSLGAHLIPELVALQQEGEEIVATLGRVRAEFVLVDQMLDLTGQTLGKTGIASLALRDGLVQAIGGLQGAGALLQPFFQDFYTEAERAASTGRLMNAELERLGIATIPATREQFRALVEAQDLNTTAGQEMFAALLRLAPAFATVTDAIGQAAAEAEAEAKRIRDSMQLLTTDSFATKFEYERYLQLAANAGVTAAQPAPLFEAPPAQVFPSFAVGTNFLPQDMTINAHAGERIIPAADNSELMQRLREPNESAQVMAEEIRQLRAELKAAHLAIARNTANTAKILSRWDGNGVPEERVIT